MLCRASGSGDAEKKTCNENNGVKYTRWRKKPGQAYSKMTGGESRPCYSRTHIHDTHAPEAFRAFGHFYMHACTRILDVTSWPERKRLHSVISVPFVPLYLLVHALMSRRMVCQFARLDPPQHYVLEYSYYRTAGDVKSCLHSLIRCTKKPSVALRAFHYTSSMAHTWRRAGRTSYSRRFSQPKKQKEKDIRQGRALDLYGLDCEASRDYDLPMLHVTLSNRGER